MSVQSSHKHLYCSRRLQLILGVTKPSNIDEEKYVQVVGYEKMIHHPQFSITSIEHNLMLIKLQTHIELNNYVKIVSLPEEPAAEDDTCTVSTWAYNLCDHCGWLSEPDTRPSNFHSSLAPAVFPTELSSNLSIHPFISFPFSGVSL